MHRISYRIFSSNTR